MTSHNIQFHDKSQKKNKKKKTLVFLSYREKSYGLKNEFESTIVNESAFIVVVVLLVLRTPVF